MLELAVSYSVHCTYRKLTPSLHTLLPDIILLKNRLAMLENKIEGVEADYGYGKVFAMHLQSDETPVCPVGTFKLWDGYSLVKAFVSSFMLLRLLEVIIITS